MLRLTDYVLKGNPDLQSTNRATAISWEETFCGPDHDALWTCVCKSKSEFVLQSNWCYKLKMTCIVYGKKYGVRDLSI